MVAVAFSSVCPPRLCLGCHGVGARRFLDRGRSTTRFSRARDWSARVVSFSLSPRARLEPTAMGAEQDEAPEFSLLSHLTTTHNEIVILDNRGTKILLLDSSHNVHSMYTKENKWTGSYWDEFASLPAVVPAGPIAMLGLGGGTAAHLMLDLWPSLEIHGWEIDEVLIDKAKEHFGLSSLEKYNKAGGTLHVHIGDALSPEAAICGGYAGIIVDLFSDGKVLPELEQKMYVRWNFMPSVGIKLRSYVAIEKVSTWLELERRLMPDGRIMVNCGGSLDEACSSSNGVDNSYLSSHGVFGQNPTLEAMCKAFPGKVIWKKMESGESLNFLALTGPPPDLDQWAIDIPEQLSSKVRQWRPCGVP